LPQIKVVRFQRPLPHLLIATDVTWADQLPCDATDTNDHHDKQDDDQQNNEAKGCDLCADLTVCFLPRESLSTNAT